MIELTPIPTGKTFREFAQKFQSCKVIKDMNAKYASVEKFQLVAGKGGLSPWAGKTYFFKKKNFFERTFKNHS